MVDQKQHLKPSPEESAEGRRLMLAAEQPKREIEFTILSLAREAIHGTRPSDGPSQQAWYEKVRDLDDYIGGRRLDLNAESLDAGLGDLYENDNGPLARALDLLRGD